MEQQQQHQQQEPTAPKKSYWSRKRAAVGDNVSIRAKALISAKMMSITCSIIVATISYIGAWDTDETCESRPVALKSWFRVLFFVEILTAFLYVTAVIAVVSIMNMQVSATRARVARQSTAASAPAAGEDPAPAPQPEDEAPEEDREASRACIVLIMLFLSTALSVFVLLWSFLGFLSAIHASGAALEDECSSGRFFFWVLMVLTYINIYGIRRWTGVDTVDEMSSSRRNVRGQAADASAALASA